MLFYERTLSYFKQRYVALTLILILAFFLRVIDLPNNPPALYGDELTITYDAYSILKTGHDQQGNFLPITFSMGAGRPGGYVYATIPFVALFGPTALGVRLLSVLSGVGIVFLIYLLGKKMFSKKIGLIAAFLTTISPWDISLSRGGFEAHFALFLALLGTWFFIQASKKPWLYVLSALCFGLTIHTYPTYKVALPLFFLVLIWFQGGVNKLFSLKYRLPVLIAMVVLLAFVLVSISQTFIGGSEARFFSLNVFSQHDLKQTVIQQVNQQRTLNNLPHLMTLVFHNQPERYLSFLSESYIQNFSLNFLFLHGDGNPRHNMAEMGELLIVEFVLVVLGIIILHKHSKRELLFLLGWIVIAPIPAALLLEQHALRGAFMLPPLMILSGLGVAYLWELTKNKYQLLRLIFVIVLLGQFIIMSERIYFLSPNVESRFWAYPAKQASEYILSNQSKYDYIIVSDRIDNIEFAYPVYTRINPSQVIEQNHNRVTLEGLKFKKFANVYIGNIPDKEVESFIGKLSGSVLYLGYADQLVPNLMFYVIPGKDKLPSFVSFKKI